MMFRRTPIRLPSFGRRTPPSGPRKLVFVSYGLFDSNSAGHISGFANELAGLGYAVAVCGSGNLSAAHSFGAARFESFTVADLAADPEGVIGFDGRFAPEETALVCWTPREIVRRAVEPIHQRYAIPYLVHLEDNEAQITEAVLARLARDGVPLPDPFPEGWSDPQRLEAFLAGAAGLTVIQERLAEILPEGPPVLVLEPGVDFALFGAPLSPVRRASVRRAAGAGPGDALIAYTGNIHDSNVEEMRALYEAVALLRGRGRKLVLARTGTDHVLGVDYLEAAAAPGSGVRALGQVDRPFLVELLKAADLFVQPGRPGPFNDYRLPSKLPEFMAVGRPVILPRANIGLQLTEGEEALLLDEGSAGEIAGKIAAVLDDPRLAARLAANAQAFARRRWRWDRQAGKLAAFLARVG
jgi:glycosyltransferase involved in cell wall biosynthesis